MITEVCCTGLLSLSCHLMSYGWTSEWCTCQVYEKLGESVKDIDGARMEDNKFCVSVHYRNVAEDVIVLYLSVYISYKKCALGLFELNMDPFKLRFLLLHLRTIKRFSIV
jgi:Zn-finger protein